MWALARLAVTRELCPGAVVRNRRVFFPGLARVPGRSDYPYCIYRMVIATTEYPNCRADIDVPESDCILYVCTLARSL